MKRRVFTALLLGSAVGGVSRLAADTPDEVSITAMKFDFIPDTIKVKRGKPVTLVLTSLDRVHGFKMPDFGVRTDIMPSEYTRVTIAPEKAGTFSFFCDVFCGDGHEDMNGTLIVED